MIWLHGQDELDKFVAHLNSCHATIKFTAEVSTSRVDFLDTTVKYEDGRLWTDLYTKPTDSHSYLRYESCHPKHTMFSLPFSQFLRVRRNCTKLEDFEKHGMTLVNHFTKRGYPLVDLFKAYIKVRDLDRQTLIFPAPKENKEPNEQPLVATSTWHPTDHIFPNTVKTNWRSMGDPATKNLFEKPPKMGFRRQKNLADHLVRAKCEPTKERRGFPTFRDNKTGKLKFRTQRV